ncbi:MAG: hypothetical protein R3E58_08440 [Phycisphaerae bacterium]|nr:hypothetical protein [Phycisphaerales bacterium]
MNEVELRDEINKRLTLNWLIQGAAQHAGMTIHHLMRDELAALNPKLLLKYDQFAVMGLLQYWHPEAMLFMGSPSRFWRRAATKENHPFFGHPLLSAYGGTLAAEAKRRVCERCKKKGVTRIPLLLSFQATYLICRLYFLEEPHRQRLVDLAKGAASAFWGIPVDRLCGDLADKMEVDDSIAASSLQGKIIRVLVAGYSRVERDGGSLKVYGRAKNFHLLTHELVKGTAELICLHGLNTLSDDVYAKVTEAADKIEYESWMLQSGGELWRRLLAVTPKDRPIARVLMNLARLPAKQLEPVIAAVIEDPDRARILLANLDD